MENFSKYLEKYDRGEIKDFEELYQSIKDKKFGYDQLKKLGKRYISYREPSVVLNFAFKFEKAFESLIKKIAKEKLGRYKNKDISELTFSEVKEMYFEMKKFFLNEISLLEHDLFSKTNYIFLKSNKLFDKKNDKDKLILFDEKGKINFIIDLELNKNNLEKTVINLVERTYSSNFSIIKSQNSKLKDKNFEKLSNNKKMIKNEYDNKFIKLLKRIFKKYDSNFIEIFEIQDDNIAIKYFKNKNLKQKNTVINRKQEFVINDLIDKIYKIDARELGIKREEPCFKEMNKSDISGKNVDGIKNEKYRNNIKNRDINEENYKLYNFLKFKAKEKLLTLNYNDNKEEIEEIFKNIYGDLNYEQNLQLLLDENKKIIEIIDTTLKDGIKEIIDSVVNKTNKEKKRIDRIIKSKYNIDNDLKNISNIPFYDEKLSKIIKKNKEVNYFVNLHNHPENIPVPSIKDLNVNNIVYKNIINKIFRETKRKIILYEDLIITKDNIVDINLVNDLMPVDILSKIDREQFSNVKNIEEKGKINIYLKDDELIKELIEISSIENKENLVQKYKNNFEESLREKLEKIMNFEK